MLSRNRFNGQDGTGVIQHKRAKKKDLAKKRMQSPKVAQGLRSKIQKFLQGTGEHSSHDSCHSTVEIEKDMFVCGIKRVPSSGEFSCQHVPNDQGHTGTLSTSSARKVDQNKKGSIKIACNGPLQDDMILDEIGSILNEMDKRGALGQGKNLDGGSSFTPSNSTSEAELDRKQEEPGSSDIVEHILKELRGINKIQAEISDLRQYLTSVRGSVDEVSCCVDAVLTEIESLRTGATAGPFQPERPKSHCGSFSKDYTAPAAPWGMPSTPRSEYYTYRKNDTLSSTQKSPMRRTGPTFQASSMYSSCSQLSVSSSYGQGHQDTLVQSSREACSVENKDTIGYLDQQHGQEFPSTSSLSSGNSSKSNSSEAVGRGRACSHHRLEYKSWAASGMLHSVSGEAVWSEEGVYSQQNSVDEGERSEEPDLWDQYGGGDTSSTPGQSSLSSSEHLSLLFGRHYNSPSTSPSLTDWRVPKHHLKDPEAAVHDQMHNPNLECKGPASYLYSRSSGYHTMEAYADETASGPSRSLSHNSTIILTDCDDYCQHCELCPLAETQDTGSTESVERDWTDQVYPEAPGEEGYFCLNPAHSGLGSETSELPNVGFNVKTIGKAVLTFQSALKGALRKLEGTSSPGLDDISAADLLSSFDGQPSTEVQWACSPSDKEEGDTIVSGYLSFEPPLEQHRDGSLISEDDMSQMENQEGPEVFTGQPELQCSQHTSHSLCTFGELLPAEIQAIADEPQLVKELPSVDDCLQISAQANDLSQQEARRLRCLNNFQQVLKEKRQVRQNLSRIAERPKSALSEEFIPASSREDDQVTLETSIKF
ncbi:uncharacterized protein LOC125745987 [Brienomyrus brachyistius]|uniref:uncharacterized protein LOC125745987 n=1 Tax=Brienomyrus brachyistius TaxID=42636 RepID=UPI0020B18FFF|nr:uncharacterized protein LOC125745987 [Brienomyrus brachyistius]